MAEAKKYDFEFEGIQYHQKTLKEAGEVTGIPWRTLQKRQLRGNYIQEAIDFKRVKHNKVKNVYDFEFEGKKYYQENLKEVAEIIVIEYGTLRERMKIRNIQEAIDFKRANNNKVKNLYDFTYQGKEYKQKSIPEIAGIVNINKSVRLERLKQGESIQDLIKD